MGESDWSVHEARTMTVFLNGDAIPTLDERGRPVVDDDFLMLINGDSEDHDFRLPGPEWGKTWTVEIDTSAHDVDTEWRQPDSDVLVPARAVIVLRCPHEAPTVPAGAAATPKV